MDREKVLLFDLGGVLVESTGRRALLQLLPHLDEARVLELWHASAAVDRFERGMISAADFAKAFIRDWGLRLEEDAFLQWFASWVPGFHAGAEPLLAALRPRHRLACLSNTNSIHWARLTSAPQLFDHCFASHLTGFMKPDREAYEHALRAIGSAPEDVYFFDDLARNVEAARAAGINAFEVLGLAQTKAALRAARLLS